VFFFFNFDFGGCSPALVPPFYVSLSCSDVSYNQLFDIVFCLITGIISYLFPELSGADFVLLWYHAVGCHKAGMAYSSLNGNNCV
jgi:hypothetical protein